MQAYASTSSIKFYRTHCNAFITNYFLVNWAGPFSTKTVARRGGPGTMLTYTSHSYHWPHFRGCACPRNLAYQDIPIKGKQIPANPFNSSVIFSSQNQYYSGPRRLGPLYFSQPCRLLTQTPTVTPFPTHSPPSVLVSTAPCCCKTST